MTAYAAIESSSAEWFQPATFERRFELRIGQTLLADLTFRSGTGTLAVAAARTGSWSYKRVGFLNPRVTLRIHGAENELGLYQPRMWGDGTLTFADGPSYGWKPTNFWQTAWSFVDASSRPVVRFAPGVEGERLRDAFKSQYSVEIDAAELGREQLPLLLTFGMYLLVLRQDDAAVAAAAVG